MTKEAFEARWSGMTPRERDAWVAERVMGWERKEMFDQKLNLDFFADPTQPMYRNTGKTDYLCRPGRLADPEPVAARECVGAIVIGGDQELPHFTTDPTAAWSVVEAFTGPRFDGRCVVVGTTEPNEWGCEIGAQEGASVDSYTAIATTMPEAVCRCALMALEIDHG